MWGHRRACRATPIALLLFLLGSHAAASRVYRGGSEKSSGATSAGKIKHVVVLMMENRSFDHLLGWLNRRIPDVDGLTGQEYNLMNASDPLSTKVLVSDGAEFVDPDPGHSFHATREQVFGGHTPQHTAQDPAPMSGFAQQAESLIPGFSHRVMSAFRPEAIPVTTELASEFAVFDRWFSSLPGPTQPNRFFLHSATSHGALSNSIPHLLYGFPQRTIYDDLDDAGLSFGVYFHDVPSSLFLSSLRKPHHLSKYHWFTKFISDARTGMLPSYSFLEPRFFDLWGSPANDDHPSHDVSEGQWLIKEVYEALRAGPHWNETLLLITYDEHGGFFDHVPTPLHGVPSPDGIKGIEDFKFDMLGVRVPTIAVSPWIPKHTVVHDAKGPQLSSQYEHSSVPATVRRIFDLPTKALTQREAWAGTFDWLLDLRDTPRTDCPETLPAPTKALRHSPPREHSLLTEWQAELVQMTSTLHPWHTSHRRRLITHPGKLTVKEGSAYAKQAVHEFLWPTKQTSS